MKRNKEVFFSLPLCLMLVKLQRTIKLSNERGLNYQIQKLNHEPLNATRLLYCTETTQK